LDKNLGDDGKKAFDTSSFGNKKELNDGLKGFKKKYPTADHEEDYDRYTSQMKHDDLNDIEEEEIDYRKKRN